MNLFRKYDIQINIAEWLWLRRVILRVRMPEWISSAIFYMCNQVTEHFCTCFLI